MIRLPDLMILMNGVPAARLSSDSRGSLSLVYDGGYVSDPDAVPLSLAMPLTDEPYGHRAVERWVDSLLPDNPGVVNRWYQRTDVQQRSPFGLLSTRIGLDCAGAVQFCPVGAEDRLAARSSGIQPLSADEVSAEMSAIVGAPDAWHSDDLEPYFSLSGFQSKIALHRIDGEWARIHQEDMCQALGAAGHRKYEHSGGPGMAPIGDLIWQHSTDPDSDIRRFADALIYAWLVVNRDAHARNYSILHTAGSVRIAPLYDVNSPLMFKRSKLGEANMAMRYGRTFTVYSAGSARALPDVAVRLRIAAAEIVDRAGDLASGLPTAMEAAAGDMPAHADADAEVDRFLGGIARRSSDCLATISQARRHISSR